MSVKPTVIDLFSGCGGLSKGFIDAGYEIVAGLDNWEDALETFVFNHPGAKKIKIDLAKVVPRELEKKIGKRIDVVIGGPPCQGFSISGKRNPDDPRNLLYRGFVKTVAYFKPKAFLLENVPNLVSMNDGKVKDEILREFKNIGYAVNYKILLASDYGVPQNRRRVVFVGIRGEKGFEFPRATNDNLNKVSSKMAISDLPQQSVEDGGNYPSPPKSNYQEEMRKKSTGIFNHQITIHTPRTIEIISQVPDGGNYKNLSEDLHHTRKVNIAWTRLNSKLPSFTIDTGHNHHFHYCFNRVPTARESARIQSFPDNFIFLGGKTSQLKQIGNAVPPRMANVLAKELLNYLKE